MRALSSAITFFEKLKRETNVPVHIILGNHDMNLKHSTKVSSLDVFDLTPMKMSGFHLYRDMQLIQIGEQECFMIPYNEDQSIIERKVKELEKAIGSKRMKSLVVFGHLSITGATQNNSSYKYIGGLRPGLFFPTKRTFTGHFHHHHRISKVVYVGAPLQFNFGDAGDKRGVVIYDTEKNHYRYIVNPHCYQYVIMNDVDVDNVLKKTPSVIQDTFTKVIMTGKRLAPDYYDSIRTKLLDHGALAVQSQQLLKKVLSMPKTKDFSKHHHLEDLLKDYAKHVREDFMKSSTLKISKKSATQKNYEHVLLNNTLFDKLVAKGIEIVRMVKDSSVQAGPSGSTFDGQLKTLTIVDFLGVQGTLTIRFNELNDGIWSIEGKNGAGKSTIIEAIVWVQFGQCLRSGMQKDYSINDNASRCMVRLEYSNGFIVERQRRRGRSESLKTYRRVSDDQLETLNESESFDSPTKTSKQGSMEYQEDRELGSLSNTQKLLCDTLGIDFSTFTKSVVLGQNTINNFVSGSKEERRKIIEEMLGLETLNALFDETKELRTEIEKEIFRLNERARTFGHELSKLTASIQDIENRLEGRREQLNEKTKALEEQENLKVAQFRKIEDNVEKVQRQLKKLHSSLAKIETYEVEKIQAINIDIETKANHLNHILNNDKSCPSCGQAIDDNHTKKVFEELKEILDTNRTSIFKKSKFSPIKDYSKEQAKVLLTNAKNSLKEGAQILTNQKQRQKLLNQVKSQELALSKLENEKLKMENELSKQSMQSEKTIASLTTEISLLETRLSDTRINYNEIDEKSKEDAQILQIKNEDYDILKFWEMSFDKRSRVGLVSIRSYVVEDAIKDLNVIIGMYIDQLAANSELKVTLTPDLSIEEVYAKRSGGERKRTDLAVLFSLFDLIRERSRYIPDFLILDEVFDSLDAEGRTLVAQVLSILSNRLRKIFIVTHTDMTSVLPLTGTFNIEMHRNESGKPLGSKINISSI